MTEPLTPDLVRIGDVLEHAAAADLAATAPARVATGVDARRRPSRRRRRIVLAGIAAAILIPTVAVAANQLIGGDQVAASMPAGTLSLAGTEPTCTVVRKNVEFHCLLARPPAPEVSDWKGTVEPTVDASSHVNGGCRSLVSDGTEWQCYIGQEAVDQQIIGQDLLGQVSSGPGVG
jgi:hypothetical protein